VAEALWYNTNKGVFGSITNIVLSTVFIFIIFGVLLEGTGAGDTLLKFAFLVTRHTRGGRAHAAILASSMFGTMSGSTVANIVGTGTFTIPMIKKRGFSPTFAGGIEATASSGGQIMPPIMGAAALVMADLTGAGYLNIIIAALFPVLFYNFSLFSALLVAMVGALILVMGMPTLPAYLIIILVMGPAIQALGVSMLTAHMFVFYYGVASSLTPPVAIAAYAAAPIAGANPLMTAFMSFRLGMSKFIIPFIFAFYPTILIIEEFSLLPFIWIVARTCFCIWLFSSALSGFDRSKLSIPEIVLRFGTAFTMLAISPAIHLPAVAFGIALILFDMRRGKANSQTEVAS